MQFDDAHPKWMVDEAIMIVFEFITPPMDADDYGEFKFQKVDERLLSLVAAPLPGSVMMKKLKAAESKTPKPKASPKASPSPPESSPDPSPRGGRGGGKKRKKVSDGVDALKSEIMGKVQTVDTYVKDGTPRRTKTTDAFLRSTYGPVSGLSDAKMDLDKLRTLLRKTYRFLFQSCAPIDSNTNIDDLPTLVQFIMGRSLDIHLDELCELHKAKDADAISAMKDNI